MRSLFLRWEGSISGARGASWVFAAGGNRSYPEFWSVTDGPWYLGCITMIVCFMAVKEASSAISDSRFGVSRYSSRHKDLEARLYGKEM
jgi:hypothetical protein